MTDKPAALLSHKLDLARLGDAPPDVSVIASTESCIAIAAAFGLPAIGALSGIFRLRRGRDGRMMTQTDMSARITQICVVTLESFEQRVAERATLVLLTEKDAADTSGDDLIDPDAPDEIVADGTIVDFGAILVEQLALAIDPYPRKPGAVIPGDLALGHHHPFAALARLHQPDPDPDTEDDT
ncbi:MAG: DUF177 domain-containing protein [Acidiphilium sp.]|nr:DUF177 domain-containing protein [Acidiphilium sp.]MDD4935448.1 DUF177 domain-containing protein [Acidiphilium sp.]